MRMKKSEQILLYSVTILVLGLLAMTLKQSLGVSKVVYVDIGRMLEGYKFKKDLENEGNKNLYQIKATVDSLKLAHKVDAGNAAIDSQVLHAQRAFDQYYVYSNQELSKKVWERLNPLLEQYGKERGYELVVGANGAGTVLHGAKNIDVTDDAVKYINEHYAKGN